MSGDAGDQPASRGLPSPSPIAAPNRSGRELKARIWLGLPLVVIGVYLLGDTVARLRLAGEFVAAWWPWALMALAAANGLRSVLQLESLIAPGLLAFAALVALGVREGIAAATLVNLAVPAVIALTGVGLLASVGSWLSRSWTRILVTGQVVAPGVVPGVLRPRAILGELRVDLSALTTPPNDVQVTAVFGHVHLTVPAAWQLNLRATGALLTSIRGLIGTGPPEVKLRVLGFCGVVSVVRAAQTTPEPTEKPQA
ncbi:MAG: hypothetical protein ACRDTC_07450 [Pseudonocardiaceae bacterium]